MFTSVYEFDLLARETSPTFAFVSLPCGRPNTVRSDYYIQQASLTDSLGEVPTVSEYCPHILLDYIVGKTLRILSSEVDLARIRLI